jgi:hypothetical protein
MVIHASANAAAGMIPRKTRFRFMTVVDGSFVDEKPPWFMMARRDVSMNQANS